MAQFFEFEDLATPEGALAAVPAALAILGGMAPRDDGGNTGSGRLQFVAQLVSQRLRLRPRTCLDDRQEPIPIVQTERQHVDFDRPPLLLLCGQVFLSLVELLVFFLVEVVLVIVVAEVFHAVDVRRFGLFGTLHVAPPADPRAVGAYAHDGTQNYLAAARACHGRHRAADDGGDWGRIRRAFRTDSFEGFDG